MQIKLTLCQSCTRLHDWYPTSLEELKKPRTCDAYPEGIPADILEGTGDHRNPRPDDNGLFYELMAGGEDLLNTWQQTVGK